MTLHCFSFPTCLILVVWRLIRGEGAAEGGKHTDTPPTTTASEFSIPLRGSK
ncbi:hypothetical protein K1T71_004216 [Dendrolimus kikuchii]|uniref:Uncharacterized protein n=1 Tax=Dendrolimus kikuchii TaxID=765133 RepID=A0ACC1DAC0_9NEOP|nr:hypothetical protein K1T71_004216 [Dendrolimus kikuchii]